ncbi:hypothetical protein ACFL1K_05795 [Candidatus Omnitrophota bacterium]
MNRCKPAILISILIFAGGCTSIPRVESRKSIAAFIIIERELKRSFAKDKSLFYKDFRGNDVLVEDVDELKKKIEAYIRESTGITEIRAKNLRDLKVVPGATEGDVVALLGKPDQISSGKEEGSEVWVYRQSKATPFMVVFLPVWPVHSAYRLHLRDQVLQKIEGFGLEQTFEAAGIGIIEEERKSEE